jgi:hypothetical protein
MGNRVLIQFVDGEEFSPAIYGHCHGAYAHDTLTVLREQMADRPNDMGYVSARCVARMVGVDNGSTGFGLWNADHKLCTSEDSHGDAGIFSVDISRPVWHVTVYGGFDSERGDIRSTPTVKFSFEDEKEVQS